VILRHAYEAPRPIWESCDLDTNSIAEEVEELALWMLEKRAEDRPQSLDVVLEEVAKLRARLSF
jgi:hypothetical protein